MLVAAENLTNIEDQMVNGVLTQISLLKPNSNPKDPACGFFPRVWNGIDIVSKWLLDEQSKDYCGKKSQHTKEKTEISAT